MRLADCKKTPEEFLRQLGVRLRDAFGDEKASSVLRDILSGVKAIAVRKTPPGN